MTDSTSIGGKTIALTAVIALLFGFGGAALYSATGMGDAHIREYMLENPEILPEMAERYQAREAEQRLASAGSQLAEPFPGAVLGNPQGSVTLIEFSDYACGYCRSSVAEVEALVAANPDLKVVMREIPILAPESEAAARMALAAAQQGKFPAFHKAMFDAGRPNEQTILAAAGTADLDIEQARTFAASQAADAELQRNLTLASQLGFDGTPSWIVGGKVFQGAVGRGVLQDALDAAKES